MTPRPHDTHGKALADTCIEISQTPPETATASGRGSLLQIYPVPGMTGLIRLTESRVVLGRDSLCQVVVDDTKASRRHLAIEQQQGKYFVSDLNSTNGSWVNDAPLAKPRSLSGGELIRIGNTIFKFLTALDEEAEYHAVVHELMTRDSLTNAFNRAWMMPFLDQELQRCRQVPTTLSAALVDLDHFKQVNDRHGHLVGDEVLRTFCERARSVLDADHRLCRFGGDEFVIVFPDTALDVASSFAELICREIADTPFTTQSGRIKISCSIGVTCSDGQSLSNMDQLLLAADRLLYRAKDQGRNCVHRADGQAMASASR